MRLQVVAPHRPSNADPLAVSAGEPVVPGRRDPDHPGWVWCVDPRGRGGWTPESFLEQRGERWICARDYDSRELTVDPGEVLDRVEEHAGWVRCRTGSGELGWVPAATVRPSACATPTALRAPS